MQTIIISHSSDAGQRIDRFCKKYLPNAALGAIYKMLRTGKIKVNGKKKDPTYKIELDDEIFFWMSDDEIAQLKIQNSERHIQNSNNHAPGSGINNLASGINAPLSILYEDEYIMVVNKPAGLNVHAGDHKTQESNLIDQVQDYLKGKHDSLTFRPALAHRIDRDTSGCVLIAKEKKALEQLLISLQSHRIEKIYHTIVFGIPSKKEDTIRAKLLRIENAQSEAKVRVDPNGQNAVTHYRVIQNSEFRITNNKKESGMSDLESGINSSLLECRIETGRTHQIRVHLAHIGYPIVGDKAYGNKKYNSYFSRNLAIHRQMLHARKLVFIHPITQKTITVEAPYHDDFLAIMSINCS